MTVEMYMEEFAMLKTDVGKVFIMSTPSHHKHPLMSGYTTEQLTTVMDFLFSTYGLTPKQSNLIMRVNDYEYFSIQECNERIDGILEGTYSEADFLRDTGVKVMSIWSDSYKYDD